MKEKTFNAERLFKDAENIKLLQESYFRHKIAADALERAYRLAYSAQTKEDAIALLLEAVNEEREFGVLPRYKALEAAARDFGEYYAERTLNADEKGLFTIKG